MKIDNKELQRVVEIIAYDQLGQEQSDDLVAKMGILNEFVQRHVTKQTEKLQAFKDYVHQRLDAAGVEREPHGIYSKAGCRVGDRLDIVLGGRF